MLGGTHDEMRTRAGFVVLLWGVRRCLALSCAYVHNMCKAVAVEVTGLFLRCIHRSSAHINWAGTSVKKTIRIPRRRTPSRLGLVSPESQGQHGRDISPWCDMATVPDSRRVTGVKGLGLLRVAG